jgi:hypothetical protein
MQFKICPHETMAFQFEKYIKRFKLLPGKPMEEAATDMERSKLQAVLRLASEASRSNKPVPLNPKNVQIQV